MKELEEFTKSFVPGDTMASCIWHRDIVPEFVEGDMKLLPWGKEAEFTDDAKLYAQRLYVLRLAWHMDVEEMFYIGDVNFPGRPLGLLNGGFEDASGDVTLVDPLTFADIALTDNYKGERPCKWLTLPTVNKPRFSYRQENLRFRLRWPKLEPRLGPNIFRGGIVPLAWSSG